MDEDKMKLLIVGDSFMKPDLAFPGQHFSEMLPGYEINCQAQDSSSNGMIAVQLFEGLEQKPDAVILGFTMFDRIEFDAKRNQVKYRWYSNGMIPPSHTDEQLTVDYYQATVSHEMMYIRSLLIAKSCLLTLTQHNIPFAYTVNGLYDHPNNGRQHWRDKLLGEFDQCQTEINFTHYPDPKFHHPSFHVDNLSWQQQFANQCLEILSQQPVDNYKQT